MAGATGLILAARRVGNLIAAVAGYVLALAAVVVLASAVTGSPSSAQGACLPEAETEPNNAETDLAAAPDHTGPICVSGTLPGGDQDLFLWELTPAEAAQRWTVTVTGIPYTLTALRIYPILTEPGVTPVGAGGELLAVESSPDQFGSVFETDLFLPAGRFLLGISRSDHPDGTAPLEVGYGFSIEPGDPLPDSVDQEPNDSQEQQGSLDDVFRTSGDLQGSADHYAWTIPEGSEGTAWELRGRGLAGTLLLLALRSEDGQPMLDASSDLQGRLEVHDLRLAPGQYSIVVTGGASMSSPYLLESARVEPVGDPEPNDAKELATVLDPASPVIRGRLATSGDRDFFRLEIPEGQEPVLRDIRLIWRPGIRREVCLLTADGDQLQCRGDPEGAVITNVLLRPGTHLITVSGETSLFEGYLLRIDPTSAPAPDFEAEPNDRMEMATPFDAPVAMRGSGDPGDTDTFLVRTDGEAQLWDITVTGDVVDQLRLLRADHTQLAVAEVDQARTTAIIRDLFLVPGDHYLDVTATSGDYTIRMTPQGPPDPNAEREPNNGSILAEPYRLGRNLVGRLAGEQDIDVFRFSLAAQEHLRLLVEPPADGSVDFQLSEGGRRVTDRNGPGPGLPLTYDGFLRPGDYTVTLSAQTPSEERYRLTIERLDPFEVVADREPNDTITDAQPMPSGLLVRGMGAIPSDEDWFVIPPSADGSPIVVDVEGDASRVSLSDGANDIPIDLQEDGDSWLSGPLPPGVPLYLRVLTSSDVPYTLRLPGASGGSEGPAPEPAFQVALQAATTAIAAYWPEGQRIDAVLTVDDGGPTDDQAGGATEGVITLDAVTSNYLWSVELGQPEVTLGAAGPVQVPIVIRAPPDAWADVPVRITVRARDGAGGWRTAFAEITPERDAPPVAAAWAWPLPEGLLGGVDAAALSLGASVVAPVDAELEEQLHDGTTHVGLGWYLYRGTWTLPVALTVDLAGDEPVPVAGTIINPQADQGLATQVPRAFELLLSPDGVTWQPVLTGELAPVMTDQAFVLDAPVAARFAQLRILSSHGSRDDDLALGEWKVVATPGALPADPVNVADLSLGGHVSWIEPHTGDPHYADGFLTEDTTLQEARISARTRQTWAIGFRNDRAALVTELQWVDPPGSDPKLRFRHIDIAVSLQGPAGPWKDLGRWELKRSADGSVAPFVLPEPTWARSLRFMGSAPKEDAFYWQQPATLRVIESATGPSYRSVIGEWGALSPHGPMEWLEPPRAVVIPEVDAADDTPEVARDLVQGSVVADSVDRNADVDWHRLTVPDGHNTLSITLSGRPILAAALTLVDREGFQVPMLFVPGTVAGTIAYSAEVAPGSYLLKVEQPISSVVLTYDTSASMAEYFPFVFEGLRSFTADVVPGEEAVKIMPFEEDPLLKDWSDQPWELRNAIDQFVLYGLSSGAEAALIDASEELSTRQGARAILILTDAETSTYGESVDLWKTLAAVRPLVFAAHVGAIGEPVLSEQYMQDWASVAGGYYQYARSHGELDRAFDRLATWLRRPAAYEVSYTTHFQEVPVESRKPGTLSVAPPTGEQGAAASAISTDVGVEIILDTSGSMRDRIDGTRRIDVAKRVLEDLVRERLPVGAPVALRILGDRSDICGTRLAVPLGPLDPDAMSALVDGIVVDQEADTALGAALASVPDDLAGSTGTRIVVLITDSEERWPHPDLCGVDPAAAIRDLRRRGIDARVNIVGLAVSERRARQQMRRWAQLGNGSYFDARDGGQLGRAMRRAVSAPFRVLDADGNEVASGTVGGQPTRVPPGTYSVVVLADPVATFEVVIVRPGEDVSLTMPIPEERVPSEGVVPEASPGP